MVRIHGGKPPVYSVVFLAHAKEPFRRMLEQLLNRPLTCGVSSFNISAHEAHYILRETLNKSSSSRYYCLRRAERDKCEADDICWGERL